MTFYVLFSLSIFCTFWLDWSTSDNKFISSSCPNFLGIAPTAFIVNFSLTTFSFFQIYASFGIIHFFSFLRLLIASVSTDTEWRSSAVLFYTELKFFSVFSPKKSEFCQLYLLPVCPTFDQHTASCTRFCILELWYCRTKVAFFTFFFWG